MKQHTVFGVHAPAPRPTIWAAALLAAALSVLFLSALALWHLIA